MSAQENRALAHRYFEELWNRADLAVADEILAAQVVVAGQPSGPEELKRRVTDMRGVFPDFRRTVEQQVAEGDTVVTRWTARGTHHGPFLDLHPTGKRVTWAGVTIFRIADGKIADDWEIQDRLGLLLQLGAIVSSEQDERVSR